MKRFFFLCAAAIVLAGCSAEPGSARIKPIGPTVDPLTGPASSGNLTLQPGSVPTR